MKILWIVLVWPEPASSAAGVRTEQFLRSLKEDGHEVHVWSDCRSNLHRERLDEAGFSTLSQAPNDSQFDRSLAELVPDVVIFDRFMVEEQFSWRVREVCPIAVRVLDTVDLHFLRRTRERKIDRVSTPDRFDQALQLLDAEFLNEDAYREIASIWRSDLSIVASDAEVKLLTTSFQIPLALLELRRLSYLPTVPEVLPSFHERAHFISIGNFHHAPNIDSYRILRGDIWPEMRKRLREKGFHDAEFHLYGAYPTQEFGGNEAAKNGFRVKGWAGDAIETLKQYRVNLAPLRFGAGIKGKIADGWAAGTPCVTTSIGAEGMHEELPFGGTITDCVEDFVEGAIALYSQESLWLEGQSRGCQILASLYSNAVGRPPLGRTLDALVERSKTNRPSSFFGELLWHHQFRSSEYFSRWIEQKNAVMASGAQTTVEFSELTSNPPVPNSRE